MNYNYKLVSASQIEDFRRPYWWLFPGETDKNILPYDIKTLRSHSRRIYANLGPLRVAVREKAMYCVGRHWIAKNYGPDKDYKQASEEWLKDIWYPMCNVLGPEFDFQTTLDIMSINLDVVGEIFIYLTENDEGFPMIQLIPAHKVDQPRQKDSIDAKGILQIGPYKGYKCDYGVIKNKQGRPIAYHVIGIEEEDDQFIGTDNIIRLREIEMGDETRSIPTMSHGINQGRSILSLLENEQEFLEAASRIALIESNELGGLDPNAPENALALRPSPPTDVGDGATNPGNNPNGQNRVYSEEWKQSGETRYFKSRSGGNVTAFQFQRPAKEWSDFMDKLGRFLIDPIWPYFLVDKEDSLGGANARGILARANRIVQDRQDLLRKAARRIIQYAVAKGSKIKRIPTSDQWYLWDFTLPARITVDFGRDAKAEILECEAGLLDPAEVIEARGRSYQDFLLSYYRNAAMDQIIRMQVEKETGVDLSDVKQAIPIAGSGQPDEVDS
jgi:hypothetical protein